MILGGGAGRNLCELLAKQCMYIFKHIFCPGIQQLLVSLEKLSPMLEGRDDDLQFLRDMLVSNEFHSLITVSRSGDVFVACFCNTSCYSFLACA